MLDSITPVITTFNEAPNIERQLATLDWAREIVVIDSGSTDKTLELLARHPKVRVLHRSFDSFAGQWRFAVEEAGIATEWFLRLDADYLMTEALRDELAALAPPPEVAGYSTDFDYAVFGRRLRGSLYPAKAVLLRKGRAEPFDKGHADDWRVDGEVRRLRGRFVHDDWKPMQGWLASQARYMANELPHAKAHPEGMKNRLRLRPPLMPIAVFFYTLFGKGLIFNGRAGMLYAVQRLLAETVLALLVLEDKLKGGPRK